MSFFVAMRDAIDIVDDAFFVTPDQLRESIALAPEDPCHQAAVIGLLTVNHWCYGSPQVRFSASG
jgi:hypothetical protein